ncbi:kynurenine formamidase isoform X2 [Ornithorhynchus anatinus]|uniref:kynurenine formamidase isoform X2 n=1 Tax=Ornithorhynchus anatinus TaxID=9258 RepID=UPI0010A80CC0|nr:kynurenine formamidase isoform X2 [Ornithorhynchus anatinus]
MACQASCQAPCQPTSPWKEMPKEELEKQYSPSRWSPRMDGEEVVEAHARVLGEETKKARASPDVLLNVPYGDGEGEKMDFYLPTNASGAFPFFLYIHGGYWQLLSKDESGFMATPLRSRGVALAAVDYDIAPKGDLDLMVAQVRRSVVFLQRRYPCNSGIFLCGHSAGAHLVAMALLTDWADFGLRPNLKGAFLVSGIYDLEPILTLSMNDKLHMTREVAWRNSPQLLIEMVKHSAGTCEVKMVMAQYDSPEFRRQTCEFFETLCSTGWEVSLEDIAGVDHFDEMEKLAQEDYVLTQYSALRTVSTQ